MVHKNGKKKKLLLQKAFFFFSIKGRSSLFATGLMRLRRSRDLGTAYRTMVQHKNFIIVTVYTHIASSCVTGCTDRDKFSFVASGRGIRYRNLRSRIKSTPSTRTILNKTVDATGVLFPMGLTFIFPDIASGNYLLFDLCPYLLRGNRYLGRYLWRLYICL